MDRIELIRQLYAKVYGSDGRAVQAFEQLLGLMESAKSGRKEDLRRLDKTNTNGYFSQDSIGMTLYVDLFAGDLKKMLKKIDYFKELGVTYLHLMPLL
ncbi:MAG: alpha-amylase, partial [Erysipelotrichaceae bacterium]|nr:alpha-amylase [Erysipelotrichaceae bacterium]